MIEIWNDDGPGERRAALVENNCIVEIHIQRDLHPVVGECGTGRIGRKTPSGTYIMTDNAGELLVRGKCAGSEGAYIAFEVVREEIAEPGRVKPAEAMLVEAASSTDRQGLWNRRTEALTASMMKSALLDDAFDCALAGTSVAGDATISFQRTKAGLVFDVDGTGDPRAINHAAAVEISRLLRLFQIGGMAMVDFVAVDSKTARQEIADAFDAASSADPRNYERTAINGFGMMQIVRARPRPSVLDQLFGTRIASLSDETQALWLLREASRTAGFGMRTITARPAVAALLSSPRWQPLLAQTERMAGASLSIVAGMQNGGYGHVHVAQS